jgi:hypothetical protein
MPLRVDVPTIAQFVAMTGPTLFVGALLMLSLLETNWKGMFYLLGLLVTQFTAGRLSANTAGLPGAPPACTLWQLDAIGIPSPSGISLSTCMYMYTAAYFITPMLSQGVVNGYVIALLVLLTALDTVYLRQYYCNSWLAILFGWHFVGRRRLPTVLLHQREQCRRLQQARQADVPVQGHRERADSQKVVLQPFNNWRTLLTAAARTPMELSPCARAIPLCTASRASKALLSA